MVLFFLFQTYLKQLEQEKMSTLKLNKKSELCIDESQDLGIEYFNAIMELMLSTKIDIVVVGDKLQSLEHENNFMTITKTLKN